MEKIELLEGKFTTEAWINFQKYIKSLEDYHVTDHILEPIQQKIADFINNSIIEWSQKNNLSIIDTEELTNILDIFGTPSELLQFLGYAFYCPKCSIQNPIEVERCLNCRIKFKYTSHVIGGRLKHYNSSMKNKLTSIISIIILLVLSSFVILVNFKNLSDVKSCISDSYFYFFTFCINPIFLFLIVKVIYSFSEEIKIYSVPYINDLDIKNYVLFNALGYSLNLCLILLRYICKLVKSIADISIFPRDIIIHIHNSCFLFKNSHTYLHFS